MQHSSNYPKNLSRRGYIKYFSSALVLAMFLCAPMTLQALQKQSRKKPRRAKVYVSLRNHIPPIDILDGSFVVELDRKLGDPIQVGSRYLHKYANFRIGRVKVIDGEGERIFPVGLDPDLPCEGCRIEIWLKSHITNPQAQIAISDQSTFTIDSDKPLVWDTDQNQPCQPGQPCRKCRPIQQERTERHSHPGYTGSFQFERIVITSINQKPRDIRPPPGHHGGFRLMIWKL